MAPERVLSSDQYGWQAINPANYTTPGSDYRIPMTVNYGSILSKYLPLRYTIGGTVYYGVADVWDATGIEVRGAPLQSGVPIDRLEFGTPEKLVQYEFGIRDDYGSAVTDYMMYYRARVPYPRWRLTQGYIVSASMQHEINAGTTQPQVNVLNNGQRVLTHNGGLGITMSTSIQYSGRVAIDPARYAVATNNYIELQCNTASNPTNGAQHFYATVLFVVP